MKYLFTDFYLEFRCTGDKCQDNCCEAGWIVFIDDKTYHSYLSLPEPKRSWICNNIVEHNQSRRIKMSEDGRCPFLNEHNLCEIFIQISPEAMGNICKTYPRKMLPYYDVIMCTVAVSCPEVARMLVTRQEPISFEYIEDEDVQYIEGADWTLYNELINSLVITTNIIQNRSYSFWKRIYVIIKMVNIIQSHIEAEKLDVLRNNIEEYNDDECLMNIMNSLCEDSIAGFEKGDFIRSLFQEMFLIAQKGGLKVDYYEQFMNDIKNMTNEQYETWVAEFRKIEIDTEMENLAVEFVFEYFMEALQGKNLLLNIIKMCLLLIMIRTCEIITHHKKGELSENDKITIISKISRTMEHTPILDIIAKEMLERNTKEVFYQLAILLY